MRHVTRHVWLIFKLFYFWFILLLSKAWMFVSSTHCRNSVLCLVCPKIGCFCVHRECLNLWLVWVLWNFQTGFTHTVWRDVIWTSWFFIIIIIIFVTIFQEVSKGNIAFPGLIYQMSTCYARKKVITSIKTICQ